MDGADCSFVFFRSMVISNCPLFFYCAISSFLEILFLFFLISFLTKFGFQYMAGLYFSLETYAVISSNSIFTKVPF